MSDTCWLMITVQKEDLFSVEAHLGSWDHIWETDSGCELEYTEANYGLYEKRSALAKAGIPFHGYHMAGGTYGASCFAASNSEEVEADCDPDGVVMVRAQCGVDQSAYIHKEDLEGMTRYFTVLNRAKAQTRAAGTNWDNDKIQFPRLLEEIRAVGLTEEQYKELERSMDLSKDRIDELFERAMTAWEKIKK